MVMLQVKLYFFIWILKIVTLLNADRNILNGNSTEVTITTNESQIFDFKCADHTEEQYVIWYRISGINGTETEIYRNGILLTSDLGEEALAYSLNNSTEFELTMSITRGLGIWIHGNAYRCEVNDSNNDDTLFKGSTILLNVLYPPSSDNPRCVSTGYNQDYIGQTVIMSCYSLPGNPKIVIELWRNGNKLFSKDTAFDHNTNRFMEVQLTNHVLNPLLASDLEATFQCKVIWYQEVHTCIYKVLTHEPNASTEVITTEGKATTINGTSKKFKNVYFVFLGIAAAVFLTIGLLICIYKRCQNKNTQYQKNETEVEMNVPTLITTENKKGGMGNYTKVIPKSLRNANIEKDKQAINTDKNVGNGDMISESSINRYTGLRHDHIIVENEDYVAFNEDYTSTEKPGEQERKVDKRCFQEKENEACSEVTDVQTTKRLSDSHEMEENTLYSDY